MYQSNTITYSIISLGCSKNLVDSENLNGAMKRAGFIYAPDADEADVVIINTCGFIQSAKEESIDVIFEALGDNGISNSEAHESMETANLQQRIFSEALGDNGISNSEAHESMETANLQQRIFSKKVVVLGCLSQRYFNQLKGEIPEIDFIYGLYDENFIHAMAETFNISLQSEDHKGIYRTQLIEGLSYSYIKISEGCSNNCAYCAIPLIRGPHVSFNTSDIIADARLAAGRGARELIVIAQDIASYNWKGTRLPELVDEMSTIEGVDWIRLLYCHPDHCTDDIISLIAENDKVVPYIDLPFQHVSTKILNSMGRRGNYREYSGLIDRLRQRVPDIRIRSTFMLGYPGETDEDFDLLMRFLEEHRLDRVGAFVYSPEEQTGASLLKNRISEKTGTQRYDTLMSMQMSISSEKLHDMIDSIVDVIVEEKIDGKTYLGRTKYDAPEVDGIFYLTGYNIKVNSLVKCRVADAIEYDLIGEPV